MKHVLLAVALVTVGALALADGVAVSIRVGEPGFFGQIEIGNMPPPRVVYLRPVVIERVPEYAGVAPIYLHVPPGHEKHWKKHCREYDACGRPVYFVHDDWYNNEYVPRYGRGERDEGREHEREHDHDKHKDNHKEHGDRDD